MQAVILAAGQSTRTFPLTLAKPKPLLEVAGKALIEHSLDQLTGIVDEAIIVVGYRKEMLQERLGSSYGGIRLSFVEQPEQLGTAHALQLASGLLKGKFLVMLGDDIYSRKDIERCIVHKHAVLLKKVKEPSRFGIAAISGGRITGFVEKPKTFVSDLALVGVYVLDTGIFSVQPEKSHRGEYEIVDYLNHIAAKGTLAYEEVQDCWIPVAFPWDLLDANRHFLNGIRGDYKQNVDGNLIIGEGTKILPGVYAEGNIMIGKNCRIGPNCYLRGPTSIGNGCRIGNAVEIKNSVVGNNTHIGHLSYIGDSVIGDNANLGAGTITANLRHDGKNVKSSVRDAVIDTGRRKLGAIIADGVHTGIHTSIYPGRKLWPGTATVPGEVVKGDRR